MSVILPDPVIRTEAELLADFGGPQPEQLRMRDLVHTMFMGGGSGDTPADILTKLLTVDGAGSGLDADLLDGESGAHYLAWGNFTDIPTTFAPSAHVHPISEVTGLQAALDAKASLASPTLTGDPKAPTPATADNDTSIATTAHVQANMALKANVSHTHTTGDISGLGYFATGTDAANLTGTVASARISGNYTGFANITMSGDLFMSSAAGLIRQSTSDAADNGSVSLAGGGNNSVTRGAYLTAHGNEHATQPGHLLLQAGTGGSVKINAVATETTAIVTQAASYTLALTDAGKLVEIGVASANNLTVPPNSSVAFLLGTRIDITQVGAGQTTVVAGAGVTIRQRESKLKLAGQYAGASLYKRSTDDWVLFGDLTT